MHIEIVRVSGDTITLCKKTVKAETINRMNKLGKIKVTIYPNMENSL
jgi:hypothetical protein